MRTQIFLLYVRPEGFSSLSSQILDFRDPVQIYVANSVSRENAPEVPLQKERTPRRRSCISIILGQPSVVEKVHAGQTSLLAVCDIPAIPHCPPAHGGMYFSSVTQKFPDIFRFPAHTYFPFSCKYCYREENASFGAEKGEMIYESYRYRSPGRRPGPHRHSKGDPPDPEDSGGRPITDNTDTVGAFLLFHAGSGEAKPLEWYIMMVHNDRSVNFKYPFKFVSPSHTRTIFHYFPRIELFRFCPFHSHF